MSKIADEYINTQSICELCQWNKGCIMYCIMCNKAVCASCVSYGNSCISCINNNNTVETCKSWINTKSGKNIILKINPETGQVSPIRKRWFCCIY